MSRAADRVRCERCPLNVDGASRVGHEAQQRGDGQPAGLAPEPQAERVNEPGTHWVA